MAGFGQDIAAGAAGFASGGIPGAILGFGSSLFGLGQPHEDPTLRALRQQQMQIGSKLLGYANSVPGSSPDELANMSQARGMLGQQQRAVQSRAMANYNPSQGLPAGQMLANLGNAATAQQMAQQSSFLQDAAANRRQALMGAANLGMNAASLYKPQASAFSQIAGPLAQQLAYAQARQKQNAAGGGNADVNTLQQQAGGLGGFYNAPGINDPGATAPAGFGAPGAPPMDPALMAILQQSGWSGQGMPASPTPGAQGNAGNLTLSPQWQGVGQGANVDATTQSVAGQRGLGAPGNEPGGANGTANQARQSMGAGAGVVNPMLRKIRLPGGIVFHF